MRVKIRYCVENGWKHLYGELVEENEHYMRIKGFKDGTIFEISKAIPYELRREKE